MVGQSDRDRRTVRTTTTLLAVLIAATACVFAASAVAASGGIGAVVQDEYDPGNDELSTAPTIEPGTYTGLESLQRDDDYYGVEVAAGERLVVNISFEESAGDLDLVVYRNGITDRVAESRSIGGGSERVVFDATEDDTYYVLVSGYETTATYDMTISVDELPPRDQFEPNDDEASAAPIQPGTYGNLGIIDGETDVYEFEASAGDEIAARTVFEEANGDLDLTIYAPDGSTIGEGNSLHATEETVNATASSTGTYRLYVWGMAGVTTTYELELAVGSDATSQIGGGSGSGDSSSGSGSGGNGSDGGGSSGSSGGSSGLPGFGIPVAIGGIALALFAVRRRDR